MNKKRYILFGVAIILAIATIASTINSVTGGAEMANLNKKELELQAQKREIEENLVKINSTTELISKSVELGFSEVSNVIYLTKINSVAQAQ